MDRFKFNYATVIALAVLLFYAYIAAMGSLFRDKILGIPSQGRIWVAVIVFFMVVALVFLCIVMMCKAKATRWKNIGTPGQIGFGIVILVVLILAGIPFSTFLKAAKEQKNITTLVKNVKKDAEGLDKAYNEHVDNRVKAYERQLKADTTFTVTEVTNRINSLRNHLSPESTEDVQGKRQVWIEGIKEMSVWNILMRSNLDSLQYTVQNWMVDYQRRDSIRFAGEDYPYFEYDRFGKERNEETSALSSLLAELGKFHYSFFSVLIALLCWLLMLLPWRITRESLA